MEPEPEQPTASEVAAFIASVDDATLEDQITALGVDTVLAQVFEAMAGRFLPSKAPGRAAVIQYDLRLRDGSVRSWQLSIAEGSCAAAQGTDRAAQVTAEMALPRFMRLLTGALEPVAAFLSGELKVRGDVMLAQQMQSWFDRAV
ncbi:MAG TPA: SCP2 sterol-binding domain-containing protein [Candidatus Dormibacteraeota bacterium]|nr:SCP2 sterol-binding domain-containing protein [Candidatus Dormibacteraeota bacterium]